MILRSWAAILFLPFLIPSAEAVTIQASFNGFDIAETRVFDTVFDYWEQTILDPFTVAVSFSKRSLTGDTLSFSSNFVSGANGLPVSASVEVDDRLGSAFGWFVDPTPELNEEFVTTADPTYLPGRRPGPAGQNYDLLTIVHHEMAHVLGFSTFYPLFATHVGPSVFDPLRTYQGATFSTILTSESQGTHLFDAQLDDISAFHYPDLMTAFQSRGERVLPSALNLAILSDAFGYDIQSTPTPVPEPSTFILSLASLLGVAIYRARQKV